MENSVGVPLSRFPKLAVETDDTNRFTRAFEKCNHILLDSDVTVTAINIPDNCKLTCNGIYKINTSGTITVGFQGYLIGENLTIDASSCSTEDLKIVSFHHSFWISF